MSSHERAPSLEDLVVETLERCERGGSDAFEAVLAEVEREHPALAGAVRERLVALRAMGLLALAREDGESGLPDRMGDFRILSRLGEGGMGVVYLAEQTALGRRVALKLLRPERLLFPGARERFRREVEAVARLAHPGIVPIHTVGEESGVPYYAMEHVAGISLADAIAHFQERDPAQLTGTDLAQLVRARAPGASESDSKSGERGRFEGSWTECALRIARDVALALQHAHERGVVHRDVKPSNVMLTAAGRVLLLDFGLAAMQGSERLTQSGAQLGSLAYMAPEQLEGRADSIGPATDVYGLGVALYELLTFRTPFRGATSEELGRRILEGEAEPLRRRNSALGVDAETVVMTALDRDAERRYASAAAFAQDLSNVLELRPIAARRASTALRARRWAQRHPGWAAAALLSFVGLTAGPTVFALQQRDARLAIAEQYDRAEANLASALEAIDLLSRVGQDELADVPQAEEARRRILQGALDFYARFAEQRGSDPGFRREVAGAEARSGDILGLLGRHGEARGAFERAIADYEEARDAGDAPHAARRELAVARGQLADALRLSGELAAALVAARASVAELTELTARLDAELGDRTELARAHAKLAETLVANGDPAAAMLALGEATRLFRALDSEGSTGVDERLREADVLTRLAELELAAAHGPAAESALARASEALAEVPDDHALDARVREQRARTEDRTASLLLAKGDLDGARMHAERAVAIATALATDFPRVPEYRDLRAAACGTLGIAEHQQGEIELALEHFGLAFELYEDLCARFPDALAYKTGLAGAAVNVVTLETSAGDYEGAHERAEIALAAVEVVIARAPDEPRGRMTELYLRMQLAKIEHAQDRFAESLRRLEGLEERAGAFELAFCAGLAAACAVDAEQSSALDEEARTALAAQGRERSLVFLRRAVAAGLKDRAPLEQDPRLASLRNEPGFREIFEALGPR